MRAFGHSILTHIAALTFLLCSSTHPVQASAQEFALTVQKGRMSARVQGACLQAVLQEVSDETGIQVFVEPSLLPSRVSAQFQGLTVEEGLKRLISGHSYAMVFSALKNEAGIHPLKAVRVYPKGSGEGGGYVLIQAQAEAVVKPAPGTVLTLNQVEALIKQNEELTRSAVAQRISQRENRPDMGNTPGSRSAISQALERAKKFRKYQELKAASEQRKEAYETWKTAQLRSDRYRKAQADHEHERSEALRIQRSEVSTH